MCLKEFVDGGSYATTSQRLEDVHVYLPDVCHEMQEFLHLRLAEGLLGGGGKQQYWLAFFVLCLSAVSAEVESLFPIYNLVIQKNVRRVVVRTL